MLFQYGNLDIHNNGNSDDYTKFDFHNHYLTDEQKSYVCIDIAKTLRELIGSLTSNGCSKIAAIHAMLRSNISFIKTLTIENSMEHTPCPYVLVT